MVFLPPSGWVSSPDLRGVQKQKRRDCMQRMLGFLLALAVMVGMSMPSFAQEKGKAEAKKGAPAAEKKDGKEGDAKKADAAKKDAKKASKKGDKKDEKKTEKKAAEKK